MLPINIVELNTVDKTLDKILEYPDSILLLFKDKTSIIIVEGIRKIELSDFPIEVVDRSIFLKGFDNISSEKEVKYNIHKNNEYEKPENKNKK